MGFSTLDTSLKTLLEKIKSSELCLADFQRDYCWRPSQVKKLLHSICMGYPIGSILLVERSENAPLGAREFTGQGYDEAKCKLLVLDGQQRLTSLFLSLNKPRPGECAYFFDLNAIEGISTNRDRWHEGLSNAIYEVSRKKQSEVSSNPRDIPQDGKKRQTDHESDLWLVENARFPISALLLMHDEKDRLVEKAEAELKAVTAAGKPRADLQAAIDKYKSLWSELKTVIKDENGVTETKLPCTTLDKNCSLEAVARVFETINSTGTKLSMFDLMVAKCIRHKFELRKKWDALVESNEEIAEMEIEPEEFIETLYLLTPVARDGFSTEKILGMSIEHIRENWDRVAKAMSIVVRDLRKFGVRNRNSLPYEPMLVTMAATYAKAYEIPGKKLRPQDLNQFNEKIRWWFWRSIFAEAYTEGASSRRIAHAVGLEDYCINQVPLDQITQLKELVLAQAKIESLDLTVSTPSSAVYKGVVCLFYQEQQIDFYDGKIIGSDDKVDDHHLFPKNFLKTGILAAESEEGRKTATNCICNRSIITDKTNRSIGSKDPRHYIREAFLAAAGNKPTKQELEESEQKVRERFKTHHWEISGILNEAFDLSIDMVNRKYTALTREDYRNFMSSREKLIKDLISKRVAM